MIQILEKTPKETAKIIFMNYYIDLSYPSKRAKESAIFSVIYILKNMFLPEIYENYYYEVLDELKKI
jgi:hypothetical protein